MTIRIDQQTAGQIPHHSRTDVANMTQGLTGAPAPLLGAADKTATYWNSYGFNLLQVVARGGVAPTGTVKLWGSLNGFHFKEFASLTLNGADSTDAVALTMLFPFVYAQLSAVSGGPQVEVFIRAVHPQAD
jgi:hypothetical protein